MRYIKHSWSEFAILFLEKHFELVKNEMNEIKLKANKLMPNL